jgi:P27 family predicted phage terminase small subunit
MLGQLATALWIADQAAQRMASDGLLMTDQAHGDGREMRKHPAFTIWRNAVAVADTLAKQFGLTPAARARLGLEQDDGAPSLAEVLFGEVADHAGG